MSVLAPSQPALHKPKSKLRLRLGLTPPHPPPAKTKSQIFSQTAKQPPIPLQTNKTLNITTTSTTQTARTVKTNITKTVQQPQTTSNSTLSSSTLISPVETHPPTLASSTNTGTSINTFSTLQSRADSRDAFALDYDTSPGSYANRSTVNINFDTISYATASPASNAFQADPDSDSDPEESFLFDSEINDQEPNPADFSEMLNSHHYPTPSPTPSPVPSHTLRYAKSHPNLTDEAMKHKDIFLLSDQQLSDRLHFVKEIGFGNWGSVWSCQPRHIRKSLMASEPGLAGLRLGRVAASCSGGAARGKAAIKLVYLLESKDEKAKDITKEKRRKNKEVRAARVRALWGEMKILRSLRHEPHPSILQVESFVVTSSFCLMIMPLLPYEMPIKLPAITATPYFRQLASALGYLHERGITHNDIKPANVMLSHNDIPVLVDFGFAVKWDMGSRGSFLSNIQWGTPEYMDPFRAQGLPHDERASDVWSLGVTMFEILIGRTPFEEDDHEQFITKEESAIYYERTRQGYWIGEWGMPDDLQHLLRHMICPDPNYRLTAMQAYHHPSLIPPAPEVLVTPHFVRNVATFEESPYDYDQYPIASVAVEVKKSKKTKPKKKEDSVTRSSTPTALGESIKQHTSVGKVKGKRVALGEVRENERKGRGVEVDEKTPSPQKRAVIRVSREGMLDVENKGEEDPTPTKITKPAQALRVKEISSTMEKQIKRQESQPSLKPHSRPTSNTLSKTASSTTLKHKRDSAISSTSTSTLTTKTKAKEEAVLRTMRSLEGTRKVGKDISGVITRPAPEPPRPKSVDSAVVEQKSGKGKEDQRRSLGVERTLGEVAEEEEERVGKAMEAVELGEPIGVTLRSSARAAKIVPTSPVRSSPKRTTSIASPPRTRNATRPTEIVAQGQAFPTSSGRQVEDSPLAGLRDKILLSDQEKVIRFRQISQELMREEILRDLPTEAVPSPSYRLDHPSFPAPQAARQLTRTPSQETLALKYGLWMNNVEQMLESARQAMAEGREPGLPQLNLPNFQDYLASNPDQHAEDTATKVDHQFGVTPDKMSAVPAHLRTSSVQVEPATPPKWMTYEEAEKEDRAKEIAQGLKQGGSGDMVVRKGGKKERPTVSHVLKLFGTEKDKPTSVPLNGRSTPEALDTIPLKAPALRGVPSTPALRSSTTRLSNSKPLTRKSESNLRNSKQFHTLPSSFDGPQPSPRRAVYEDLLDSEPGVIRQGDGWSNFGNPPNARAMGKTSSMASLRERALAFLRDEQGGTVKERNIVDLAQEVKTGGVAGGKTELRGRPATPGAGSVMLGVNGKLEKGKGGFFGKLKGLVGGKKAAERMEEGII